MNPIADRNALLDANGFPRPLPPDPLSPIPDEVELALTAYRAGDVAQARTSLGAIAESGRTTAAGHAAMALAVLDSPRTASARLARSGWSRSPQAKTPGWARWPG
ncbi:hypothetical protein F1721_26325 [Saccharopolyspora hirsuta]|uniref:Tetratricopeptide repeat protein n=1 Tax=Saccharopolyspora hirsuta TaxID=1837 RepID=A0A5M7BPI6_SACHI|nr:hypothetical protein [Saccharopolyspora hirsuta]KAA5829184.1 hypothetical protein F1721_26325 [Saccharopolyspora hirsuta]